MATKKAPVFKSILELKSALEASGYPIRGAVTPATKNLTVLVSGDRKKALQLIADTFGGSYSAKHSASSSGAVLIGDKPFTVIAKPGAVTSASGAVVGEKPNFKPSRIVPKIVDVWLTADQIVENVTQYVNNQNLDAIAKDRIIKLLQATAKDNNTVIPFDLDKADIPSEFFEVLTSVKLAALLERNDPNTRKILGIPKTMDLRKSKIKLMIPERANLPLLDYYINISSGEKKDVNSSLKISVKSKVSSKSSNTVKFRDTFENQQEVNNWYAALSNKNANKGQKIIAESSFETSRLAKKKDMMFPLIAMDTLMKEDSKIMSVISSKFEKSNLSGSFKAVVSKASSQFSSIDKNMMISDVKGVTAKQASDVTEFMLANLPTKGKEVDPNIWNLTFLCEKILVEASSPSSTTKYNFYQMFFDQVLTKREIAYAVATRNGKTVKYSFYSKINFSQEYSGWKTKNWIMLRSKNGVDSASDALGMDI